MAFQAGVLFFDGRPIDDERRTLLASADSHGPDGTAAFTQNGLAMVYGAFHVWSGERWAQQPWRSPIGAVITWDGRLDNRDDLLLRVGRDLASNPSDAQIALTILERDGVKGLASLVGDWSLVLWDPRRRLLYLARDYMGVRPLYYYSDAWSVRWSSSLGDLAAQTGRMDALDECFVARFMVLRFSTDITPYQGIQEVPTATCVSFSQGGHETRDRFWSLEPSTIRYRSSHLYEEHLRALWREAVGGRMRTEGTVWAELSGGLDSSSVVCMGDRLVRDGKVTAKAVQPVSHVPMSSPAGDERRFIAEVEAQIGVRSEIVTAEDDHLSDDLCEWATPVALRGVGLAVVRRVRASGGRLILSGRVGDLVMGNVGDNSVAVFDDLHDGNVWAAVSGIRQWSRACRKPFLETAWCVAHEAALALAFTSADQSLNEAQRAGLDFLSAPLRQILHQTPFLISTPRGFGLSKHRLAEEMLGYSVAARLGVPTLPSGVIYTHPFVHRPLIEFVLAIPGQQLSAPSEPRSLMRRAFENLVPSRVLRRQSKGYYPPSAMRAIRPLAMSARPVQRLEIVERGWIDPVKLDTAIGNLIDGGGRAGYEIQRALRLEQWLKSRDRRAPAGTPKGEEVNVNAVLNA